MIKSYNDYITEISADELYEGLLAHGLFSDNLPPIFSAESFYDYCLTVSNFATGEQDYVSFDIMRNLNVPRTLGIPNPMLYQKLCAVLRDNWSDIQTHFKEQTKNQTYKISRLHIRKLKNKKAIFEMNYDNWRKDGTPEVDLLLGCHFLVETDISTCFPSIYTHAIPWALVGKNVAKSSRRSGWYNEIDKACRNLRNGETHGLMIGPHAFNLISEIILTVIDKRLCEKGWEFIRNIDDYKCYVKTYEEAQTFLLQLAEELREFDLPLNYKKTSICELPTALTEDWVRQLNSVRLVASYGKVGYKDVNSYFDLAIKLMHDNQMNAAVLKYAIKTLAAQPLTNNAKNLSAKITMHLAGVYPYLFSLLEEYVFNAFKISINQIKEFSNEIFGELVNKNYFEAQCYTIFYSLKYNFILKDISLDYILKSNNCVLKLFGWLYFKKYGTTAEQKQIRNHAKLLKNTEMGRNWLFVYEVLSQSDLTGDWKPMKKAGVTFLVGGL